MFGYQLTDLYQQNGYDKIHPDDIATVEKDSFWMLSIPAIRGGKWNINIDVQMAHIK